MTNTIHDTESIIHGLEQAFESFSAVCRKQNDADFLEPLSPGKWSTAQHLDHLIKSTAPVNQALRMPKITLRTMFGKCNRPERTFEEVISKYQQKLAEGGRATGRFLPKDNMGKDKEKNIEELMKEGNRLTKALKKWDEKRMSIYVLPHPLLGKMTIREILFFTIYHTHHHQKIIEKFI